MGSYWSSLGPDLGREQNQVYSEGNGIHMGMGGLQYMNGIRISGKTG